MGVSSPGGAYPLELPAELQLERGDAIAQEDQVPAPVLHGQLPLRRESQGLPVKATLRAKSRTRTQAWLSVGMGRSLLA